MNVLVWILLATLLALHQFDPFRSDPTIVFGFVPITLVYHVALSVAAAVVWFLAVRYAWPLDDSLPSGDGSAESTP